MPSREPSDRFVAVSDPMPCHYVFVSDPRIVEECRERAYGHGYAVHTVKNPQGTVVGIRVPTSVHQEVLSATGRR